MNTINFQPTGIYPQIAKNPAMLCASTNSKQETPVWENKNYKIKKNAIKALIIGGIIAVGAFIGYYNKGMKAINLKNKVIPKLPEDKTFQKYIDENAFTYKEKEFVIKTYNEGLKFENNIVGKINRGLNAIGNFFKTNFYGYRTPKT